MISKIQSSSIPSLSPASIDAPRLLSSSARRVQKEVLSDDDVSELTSPPHPEASVASVTIRWRDNSSKSHCDAPVNFPTSLLQKYDHTGFPETAFQHYCAGHLLHTDEAKPSLAASTPTKKVSAAIAVERQYTGIVLDNVTPVNLVRFWMARRDYSRLNGQEPVIAAVSDVVSSQLERKYSDTECASDSTIWGALWSVCELTPVNLASAFTDIATEFNIPFFQSLHDDASRTYVSKFATAIINAVPYWPPSTFNLKTMAKLFTAALPKPCQQALQTYFDVYNTIRAGSRLLSTIEPWNLYMAVTVLESILAYNKTQASALIASGFISTTAPPTTQRKSASPVMTLATSAPPTKPVSYAHLFQNNASSTAPASHPPSQPSAPPAVSSTSPTEHSSNKRSRNNKQPQPPTPQHLPPHISIANNPSRESTLNAQTNPPEGSYFVSPSTKAKIAQ